MTESTMWLWIGLCLLPAVAGIYLFHRKAGEQLCLWLIMLSAFLVRLYLVAIDPYLYDWDERFHALVAKNLIDNPLKPMLRVNPVLGYDAADWCCNHIWLHKQPLFLWQMALSMKVFGVNLIALRLPSIVMGTLGVYFVHDISRRWMQDKTAAFIAALIAAFSYFQIEHTTGRLSVDHNDVAFIFYMGAALWAYTRFFLGGKAWRWAVLTGVFVGCAILVKWLIALLIFGGWGLCILLDAQLRKTTDAYVKFGVALLVAIVLALPWQIYIVLTFPVETAASHLQNWLHVTEVLGGHYGSAMFYIERFGYHYGFVFVPFLFIGIYAIVRQKVSPRPFTMSLLAMVVVIYVFFSLVVTTKMPAFTYYVMPIIIALIAFGLRMTTARLMAYLSVRSKHIAGVVFVLLLMSVILFSLKGELMVKDRSRWNVERNVKMHNTMIYKNIPSEITDNFIIINCRIFEDIEFMFYRNVVAYHFWPQQHELHILQAMGYRFAAFKSHTRQVLPDYITEDPEILIIDQELR
jgi:4-amino-4-deoxy-L-arabinose transferase-like glycosyltransferase